MKIMEILDFTSSVFPDYLGSKIDTRNVGTQICGFHELYQKPDITVYKLV